MSNERATSPLRSSHDQRLVGAYHKWLMDLIDLEDHQKRRTYNYLMLALHQEEFYWTVPNDDNRAMDGRALRRQFADLHHISEYDEFESEVGGPCSVLEMLIGLANRMSDSRKKPSECFWEMLSNLFDLKECGDSWVDPYYIDHVLERFLDRTYDFNGSGGLFPLRNPQKDQRKVEIWYQMQAYLIENDVTKV